jgi:hypothetical protein
MSAKYTFLAWETPIKSAPLKLALLQLANNADDNGFSYYSISKMSRSCGMSERTFIRKISELENLGVLTVERRSNRPSLYTLIGDEMGVTLCQLQRSGVTECQSGVTECHRGGDRVSHDPNNTPNNTPNIMSVIKDGFNHWWKLYPPSRRVNKTGCYDKFKSKCKKLNEDQVIDLVNKICDDIEERTKTIDDIKYFPTSEPYMNKERYNDGE